MDAGGRSGRGEGHGAERQRHRPRGVENGQGAQGLGLPGAPRERAQPVHPHLGLLPARGGGAAGDLAHILGKSTTAAIPAAVNAVIGPRVEVAVVLGTGFTGKLAVSAPSPKKAQHHTGLPATLTPTTEYRADFVHAQQVLKFPILYPTVAQNASTFCPWVPVPSGPGVLTCEGTSSSPTRIYGIAAAGQGWNSTYAVFHMSANTGDAYWGIEETRYTDAPLLATPNATRHLDGRNYLFFFNGNHIQTIAFIQNGAAYWVQNSLLDDLTNPEMVAIARSLKARPLAVEKRAHEPVELLGLLHVGDVAGIRDRLEPDVRERPHQLIGDGVDVGLVIGADQHQRRLLDLGQSIGEVGSERPLLGLLPRVQLQLERVLLHLPHAVADRRVHLLRRAARPVHPEAHVELGGGIEVAARDGGVLGLEELARRGRPVVAGQPGADRDEPRHPRRLGQGDLERHPASQ